MMQRIMIESPYAGDITTHVTYAKRALRDSLARGEAPFASHLFYPQVLDDGDSFERALGIAAGYAWGYLVSRVVFYLDYGWSPGMRAAKTHYQAIPDIVIEERLIGQNNTNG